uniref:Solute carrier family 25 member 38 homolog n=1 Tax=Timema cristinae TaxID=61476 RepID=A0A7R9DDV5_TIMCR|nr:unnamed protein product [Timema cristinae]
MSGESIEDLVCAVSQHSIMDIISSSPLVKSFVAGSFSGTFSTIMFQPLDLVKTRLQNPMPLTLGVGPVQPSGMITIIGHILKTEHVSGLWKGMTPSIARCVPGVGLYFSSLHTLKSHFVPPGGEPGPLQAMTMGVAARTMSGVCLIPITVIKTRVEYTSIKGWGKPFVSSTVQRGFEGCVAVSSLLCSGTLLSPGSTSCSTHRYKKLLPEDWLKGNLSAPTNFSCGLVAGLLASVMTQPADVLKTKMQLYPDKFQNLQTIIVYVHKKYGVKGYFKGLVPRMLRRTLMAAMAWTVYEQVTRSIGLK